MLWEPLWIVLLYLWKTRFPRLGRRIVTKVDNAEDLKTLEALPKGDVGTFNNYVYSLEPLKYTHPAGYQIVQTAAGRDLERFLYGVSGNEFFPGVAPHDHTAPVLKMLGEPLGRLKQSPLFRNIKSSPDAKFSVPDSVAEVLDMRISELRPLTKDCSIYRIGLSSETPVYVREGYSQLREIGTFVTLSLGPVTRLYTLYQSNTLPNRSLLEPALMEEFPGQAKVMTMEEEEKVKNTTIASNPIDTTREILSLKKADLYLYFRFYPTGKLTSALVRSAKKKTETTVQVSGPRGQGLELDEVSAGTVVMVAGGTGAYTFGDFIDILYKRQLVQDNHPIAPAVLKYDPLLKSLSYFSNIKFVLFLALRDVSDVPPLTYFQIISLAKRKNLRVFVKAGDKPRAHSSEFFTPVHEYFQTLLPKFLNQTNDLSKLLVSGPPNMVNPLAKVLQHTPHAKHLSFI